MKREAIFVCIFWVFIHVVIFGRDFLLPNMTHSQAWFGIAMSTLGTALLLGRVVYYPSEKD